MASKRQIFVGGVTIGGGAPVVVQSMTLTKTHDVPATTAQIAALASAAARSSGSPCRQLEDAEALPRIVRFSPIPVIADIHFNASLALKAIEAGVPPSGSTPATSAAPTRSPRSSTAAKKAGIPMRIGANSGSLPKHLESLAQEDQAEALVEAALEEVRLLESLDYYDFKISVKSSHVPTMIRAYRMLAGRVPYPLHLGVTEAGTAVHRLDQERGRARHACSPTGSATRSASASPPTRGGGQGRLGDPEGAQPARARPGADRLPELRPRQRRRPDAARRRSRGAWQTTTSTSRSPCSAARSTGPASRATPTSGSPAASDVGFIYAHGKVLRKVRATLVDELFNEIDRWIVARSRSTRQVRGRGPRGWRGSRRRAPAISHQRRSPRWSTKPHRRVSPTRSCSMRRLRQPRVAGLPGPERQAARDRFPA